MKARTRILAVALSVAVGLGACAPDRPDRPRLLVTVVVDGLSTAQLLRHRDCLGPDGFERLFRDGAWFPRARLAHTTSFTAPGFATIATGSSPAEHGMVGNSWYDRERGENQYCVGDRDARPLGTARSDRGSASPVWLLRPPLADILRERLDGRSHSLGLSIKDRGAVMGAGGEGNAYWYDSRSGRFVTSTFFTNALPSWWEDYYAGQPLQPYLGREREIGGCPRAWHAEHQGALQTLPAGDPRRETSAHLPAETGSAFYSTLRDSPWGDEATLDFLEAALLGLELGRSRERVDQLTLGLSCLDYVGHDAGPDSPLATSVLLGLDRRLTQLFGLLDREVGPDAWTLALTADHGYPSSPELAELRDLGGGRLDPKALAGRLDAHLDAVYGDGDWVTSWNVPTFTLDRDLIRQRGLDFDEVQNEGRVALLEEKGVFEVACRYRLETGDYDGPFAAGVAQAFQGERSGDLLVLQDRHWYLLYDPTTNVATHGSPWEYDREVPLFFLGRGVRPGEFESVADVRDLAATLLALAGEPAAPSMSGQVLQQAIAP